MVKTFLGFCITSALQCLRSDRHIHTQTKLSGQTGRLIISPKPSLPAVKRHRDHIVGLPSPKPVSSEAYQFLCIKSTVTVTALVFKIRHGALHRIGIEPECRPLTDRIFGKRDHPRPVIFHAGCPSFPAAIPAILLCIYFYRLATPGTNRLCHPWKALSATRAKPFFFSFLQPSADRTLYWKQKIQYIQTNSPLYTAMESTILPATTIITNFYNFCIHFLIKIKHRQARNVLVSQSPEYVLAGRNTAFVRICCGSFPAQYPDCPQ